MATVIRLADYFRDKVIRAAVACVEQGVAPEDVHEILRRELLGSKDGSPDERKAREGDE